MKDPRKLAVLCITAGAALYAQSASAGFPFFDNFFGGNHDDDYYDRYDRYGPYGYGGGPYGWGGGPYGYGGPYGWGGGPYGYGWGGGPYGYGGYAPQQQAPSQPAPPPAPE